MTVNDDDLDLAIFESPTRFPSERAIPPASWFGNSTWLISLKVDFENQTKHQWYYHSRKSAPLSCSDLIYILCSHFSSHLHLLSPGMQEQSSQAQLDRDLKFQNKATREQKRCAVGTTMQWLWILCINVNFNRTKIPPKKLMWLGFFNRPKPYLTRTN